MELRIDSLPAVSTHLSSRNQKRALIEQALREKDAEIAALKEHIAALTESRG